MQTAFHTAALTQFRAQLQALADIPETEWHWLQQHLRASVLPAHSYLVEVGQHPTDLFYLHQGIIRFFYISEDGKEFNKAFARPGDVVAAMSAQLARIPCAYSIQALTSVDVLKLPLSCLTNLYDRHPCWDRIGRRLAENAAVRKEIRERDFLLTDAWARYLLFRERYADLIGRIAQKHIASYIGVTEVALSRLLKSHS